MSVVAGSSNYKGKHSGRTGTVKHVYDNNSSGNIAVTLDGLNNDGSSKGWFYFRESDLRISRVKAPTGAEVDATIEDGGVCNNMIISCGLDMLRSELKKIENEGVKSNMKSEKILELWKKAGMESVGAEMAEEEEGLLAADPTYVQLRQHVAEMNRLITESGVNEDNFTCIFECERFVSSSTKQKITEARSKMTEEKKNLNRLVEEIAAMLSACDTYDQEMDVLRTYGVVNADGHLNKIF